MDTSADEPIANAFVIARLSCQLTSLPDEVLARIFNFVQDPWFKLKCKRLSRRLYKMLEMKESWESSEEIEIELNDEMGGIGRRDIKINGRRFSNSKRYNAVDRLLEVISVKQLSYKSDRWYTHIDSDFRFMKGLFTRIVCMEPIRVSHLSFVCKTEIPKRLYPLPDFLRSCRSVLQSVNIDLIIRPPIVVERQEEGKVIESIWNALEGCNQLKHVVIKDDYYCIHDPPPDSPFLRMPTIIHSALSCKHLKTLSLDIIFSTYQPLIELIISFPSLEKLSLPMEPSDFVKALIDYHSCSIPIKELTFIPDIYGPIDMDVFFQAFSLDLFPNLTSLVFPNLDFDDNSHHVIEMVAGLMEYCGNRRPPLLFSFRLLTFPDELISLIQKAVIDKGGRVGAAQLTSEAQPVYILSKNNAIVLFSVQIIDRTLFMY